jgi:hypothetical protein
VELLLELAQLLQTAVVVWLWVQLDSKMKYQSLDFCIYIHQSYDLHLQIDQWQGFDLWPLLVRVWWFVVGHALHLFVPE